MPKTLKIIIPLLLLTALAHSCLDPFQNQGTCTHCSTSVQVLVTGYCYQRIVGCLQYDVGPICTLCQPGYQISGSICIRKVIFNTDSPAPLLTDFAKPLQASQIIAEEVKQKQIIQTLKQIGNQSQYNVINQDKTQPPETNTSGNQQNPVELVDNNKINESIQVNNGQGFFLDDLFELYPLLKSSGLTYEDKGNGFYVLFYGNKTTLSFRYINKKFILNRPVVISINPLFSLALEGYAAIQNFADRTYQEVLEYSISQFPELQVAPIIEAYLKKDVQNNISNLYYNLIYKMDDYYYSINIFRSQRGNKQLISAEKMQQPQVIYSNNFNYNLDDRFFQIYTSLVDQQFNHTSGILFVTKKTDMIGTVSYRIVYENQNFAEFTVRDGVVKVQRYFQRKLPSVTQNFLNLIYEKYPQLKSSQVVSQNREQNVYVFYFGNDKTISGILDGEKYVLNSLHTQIKVSLPSEQLVLEVNSGILIELVDFIVQQLPELAGIPIRKAQEFIEGGTKFYNIIFLSSTFEYQIWLSKRFIKGYSLIEAIKISHIDSNLSEIIYSIDYNYNTDRAFFRNYLQALSLKKNAVFKSIHSVFKIKHFEQQLYLISFQDGPFLEYSVTSKGVYLN